MATAKEKQFGQYEGRTVGNINSWKIRTLAHGAKVTEDVDNFTVVELGFEAETGQRTASILTDGTTKGYLIASPERRYLGENLDEFYNGKDEFARIIYLDEGLRFETSGFELDTTAGEEVTNGQFAHFDTAKKAFLVHDGTQAEYSAATDKFQVVGSEADTDYRFNVPVIRLEVL